MINFRRQIWLDVGPTQSDLRIFERFVLQTRLGVPGTGSFRKNENKWFLQTETPHHYRLF